MLGQYNDPQLGVVRAAAYANLRPAVLTTQVPDFSTYDSVVLQIRYDFYNYGSQGESNLSFNVHEITEELDFETVYYSNSQVAYNPIPLGSATSAINAEYFDQEATDTDKDSVVTVRIKLDDDFGLRLFGSIDPEDENYTNFTLFKAIFKGLAIIPESADKIVGLNIADANTTLTVYYHDVADVAYTSQFLISQGVTFSQISTDRAGTELENLTQRSTPFEPAQNRYIQSGEALITKLDLSKFYSYIDTIPNLLLNSAELVIENVSNDANYARNKDLALAALTEYNQFKTLKTLQDTLDYINFGGSLVIGAVVNPDLPRSLFAADDLGSLLTLKYSENENYYQSFPTFFFQKLITLRDTPYPSWALISSNPPIGKSVHRTIFSKDNLKLKLYYTRPTPNSNE